MNKISQHMKAVIEKETCLLATTNLSGKPNIAPKKSMTVIDDITLGFAEVTGRRTYANIKENPAVMVLVGDLTNKAGYRFEGEAAIATDGPVYDRFAGLLHKLGRPNPHSVGVIKVAAIYDLWGNPVE